MKMKMIALYALTTLGLAAPIQAWAKSSDAAFAAQITVNLDALRTRAANMPEVVAVPVAKLPATSEGGNSYQLAWFGGDHQAQRVKYRWTRHNYCGKFVDGNLVGQVHVSYCGRTARKK